MSSLWFWHFFLFFSSFSAMTDGQSIQNILCMDPYGSRSDQPKQSGQEDVRYQRSSEGRHRDSSEQGILRPDLALRN